MSQRTLGHAVISLPSSLRCPSGSHRTSVDSGEQRIPERSLRGPFSTTGLVTQDASEKSGQLTTSWGGCQAESSEDGSPSKPVRLLVCIMNESSESILVPSFMHLQMSVMVQFAVGVRKVHEALIENDKVR